MRDGPRGAVEPEGVLHALRVAAAAGASEEDDDDPSPGRRAALALAELLHRGSGEPAARGWREVLADLHHRAVQLRRDHPGAWSLATSSAVLVEDWVRGGTWVDVLRGALEAEAAGAAAVRDAPVVVVLHLFALGPREVERPGAPHRTAAPEAYPHVVRLRSLLSCDGPAGEAGGPAELGALVAAVGRLAR